MEACVVASEHPSLAHLLHVCCLKSGMPLRSGQVPGLWAAVRPRARSCSSGEVYIVTGAGAAATRDLFP